MRSTHTPLRQLPPLRRWALYAFFAFGGFALLVMPPFGLAGHVLEDAFTGRNAGGTTIPAPAQCPTWAPVEVDLIAPRYGPDGTLRSGTKVCEKPGN